MLIYTALTGGLAPVGKMVREAKDQGISKLAHDYLPPVISKKITPEMWPHDKASEEKGAARSTASINSSKDSAPAAESDLERGDYVEIEGHYYKKRSDNVYLVNGVRVFYKNQHRYRETEVSKAERNVIVDVARDGQPRESSREISADTAADRAAPSGSNESPGALPTTPGEMMQMLKKAEQNQKDQAEQLRQLEH